MNQEKIELENFRDNGLRKESKTMDDLLTEVTQYDFVRDALNAYIEAYIKYLEVKDTLEYEEARLQIHTDWSEVFDVKPTVAMKEAYIREQLNDLHKSMHTAYLCKRETEELYKLELLRYEKEGEN